jgi:hypothetical protein
MSSSSSHGTIVVVGTMALKKTTIGCVALVDALDGNILTIVSSTIVYEKTNT